MDVRTAKPRTPEYAPPGRLAPMPEANRAVSPQPVPPSAPRMTSPVSSKPALAPLENVSTSMNKVKQKLNTTAPLETKLPPAPPRPVVAPLHPLVPQIHRLPNGYWAVHPAVFPQLEKMTRPFPAAEQQPGAATSSPRSQSPRAQTLEKYLAENGHTLPSTSPASLPTPPSQLPDIVLTTDIVNQYNQNGNQFQIPESVSEPALQQAASGKQAKSAVASSSFAARPLVEEERERRASPNNGCRTEIVATVRVPTRVSTTRLRSARARGVKPVITDISPNRHIPVVYSARESSSDSPRSKTPRRTARGAAEAPVLEVARVDAGTQAGPLPWTRYYFPDKVTEGGGANMFFKHFDVKHVAPLSPTHPDVFLTEPLPPEMREMWLKLYYVDHDQDPGANDRIGRWPNVRDATPWQATAKGKEGLSSDVKRLGNSVFQAMVNSKDEEREEEVRKDLTDFVQLVAQLEPRSAEDTRPLSALRQYLLMYLTDQLQQLDSRVRERVKQQARDLSRSFARAMQAFKTQMADVLSRMQAEHQDETKRKDTELEMIKLSAELENQMHEKLTEQQEQKQSLLTDRIVELEGKIDELEGRNEGLVEQVSGLEEEVAERDKEIRRLKSAQDNLVEHRSELEGEIAEMDIEIARQQSEIFQLKQGEAWAEELAVELQDVHRENKRRMQAQQTNFIAEKQALMEQILERCQKDASEHVKSQLSGIMSEFSSKLSAEKQAAEQAQQESEKAARQSMSMQEEIFAMEAELDHKVMEVSDATSFMGRYKANVLKMNQDLASAKQELEEKAKEGEEKDAQFASMLARMNQLEDMLAVSEKRLDSVDDREVERALENYERASSQIAILKRQSSMRQRDDPLAPPTDADAAAAKEGEAEADAETQASLEASAEERKQIAKQISRRNSVMDDLSQMQSQMSSLQGMAGISEDPPEEGPAPPRRRSSLMPGHPQYRKLSKVRASLVNMENKLALSGENAAPQTVEALQEQNTTMHHDLHAMTTELQALQQDLEERDRLIAYLEWQEGAMADFMTVLHQYCDDQCKHESLKEVHVACQLASSQQPLPEDASGAAALVIDAIPPTVGGQPKDVVLASKKVLRASLEHQVATQGGMDRETMEGLDKETVAVLEHVDKISKELDTHTRDATGRALKLKARLDELTQAAHNALYHMDQVTKPPIQPEVVSRVQGALNIIQSSLQKYVKHAIVNFDSGTRRKAQREWETLQGPEEHDSNLSSAKLSTLWTLHVESLDYIHDAVVSLASSIGHVRSHIEKHYDQVEWLAHDLAQLEGAHAEMKDEVLEERGAIALTHGEGDKLLLALRHLTEDFDESLFHSRYNDGWRAHRGPLVGTARWMGLLAVRKYMRSKLLRMESAEALGRRAGRRPPRIPRVTDLENVVQHLHQRLRHQQQGNREMHRALDEVCAFISKVQEDQAAMASVPEEVSTTVKRIMKQKFLREMNDASLDDPIPIDMEAYGDWGQNQDQNRATANHYIDGPLGGGEAAKSVGRRTAMQHKPMFPRSTAFQPTNMLAGGVQAVEIKQEEAAKEGEAAGEETTTQAVLVNQRLWQFQKVLMGMRDEEIGRLSKALTELQFRVSDMEKKAEESAAEGKDRDGKKKHRRKTRTSQASHNPLRSSVAARDRPPVEPWARTSGDRKSTAPQPRSSRATKLGQQGADKARGSAVGPKRVQPAERGEEVAAPDQPMELRVTQEPVLARVGEVDGGDRHLSSASFRSNAEEQEYDTELPSVFGMDPGSFTGSGSYLSWLFREENLKLLESEDQAALVRDKAVRWLSNKHRMSVMATRIIHPDGSLEYEEKGKLKSAIAKITAANRLNKLLGNVSAGGPDKPSTPGEQKYARWTSDLKAAQEQGPVPADRFVPEVSIKDLENHHGPAMLVESITHVPGEKALHSPKGTLLATAMEPQPSLQQTAVSWTSSLRYTDASGRQAEILPVVLSNKCPLRHTLGVVWGTITCTRIPAEGAEGPAPADLQEDMEHLRLGVSAAVEAVLTRINNEMEEALAESHESDLAAAADASADGAEEGAGEEHFQEKYREEMASRKQKLETVLNKTGQFKTMVMELKRYRQVPRSICGVACVVLLLLNDEAVATLLHRGLPTAQQGIQNIWLQVVKKFNLPPKAKRGEEQETLFDRMGSIDIESVDINKANIAGSILSEITEAAVKKASNMMVMLRQWADVVLGILHNNGKMHYLPAEHSMQRRRTVLQSPTGLGLQKKLADLGALGGLTE